MENQQGVNKGIGTFLSFGAKTVQPEILERMLIGRQQTVSLLAQYVREIATNCVNHQVFIVGPRGSGKTHLLRVLYHRIADFVHQRTVVVAYFAEEEYGISGYLDFLIRIINSFLRWYDNDRSAIEEQLTILRETPEKRQEYVAESIITSYVGDKPLLILSENFDAILEALDKKGQDKLRAWLYQNNRISIIATAQAISPDMGREDRPFYGFFSLIKLSKLTDEDSLTLLQTLAQIEQRPEMIAHLNGVGKAQVKAINELVKGNHRLLVTFYEFLKADSVAELSEIFIKTMNNLKPYYETFIRFLPPQQQKILHYLALAKIPQKGTDIAKNCFIATTSLTKQLSELQRQHLIDVLPDLKDKRNKLYDVSEPLLRVAIEIGEQREGITALFIDFLALYYSRDEITIQKNHLEDLHKNETEPAKKQKLYWEAEARSRALQIQVNLMLKDRAVESTEQGKVDTLYNIQDELTQAIAVYQKAISINVNDTSAWLSLGNAYNRQNNLPQATDAFLKAIDLNPCDASAWFNLGITYDRQEKSTQAVEAFLKAIELSPDDASAWYNLGFNFSEQGEYSQAVEAFLKVTELSPDDASAWYNLGIVYNRQEQHAQAVAAYTKATELSPDDASAWYNLGFVYNEQGDIMSAVRTLYNATLLSENHSSEIISEIIIKGLKENTLTKELLLELESFFRDNDTFKIIVTYINIYRRILFNNEEQALYELPKEQRKFFEREILERKTD